VAEAAFYKGNSDNRHLFALILRLRQLEMTGTVRLHVVHVAGHRMIAQGTDGLSRGDYTTGVMAGDPMMDFVPLHQSAVDRAPALLSWVREWVPDEAIFPLSPTGWFREGQGTTGGTRTEGGAWWPTLSSAAWCLWAPAPAAASCALHQLATSRHKRHHVNHVFLCPRLLTAYWRKRLYKVADLVLELPPGCFPWWPSSMFEPLVLGLTLRFIHSFPWQLRNTPGVLDLGGQVRSLWRQSNADVRNLLRQLCELPDVLDSMPEGLVREVLYSPPLG